MGKRNFKKLILAGGFVAASASSALAVVDLTGVTVDTASVYTLAGTVLTGLGGLWGVRKLVKFINRS